MHPLLGAEDAEGKEVSPYPHGAPTLEQGFMMMRCVNLKKLTNRLQRLPAHPKLHTSFVYIYFWGRKFKASTRLENALVN